MEIRVLSLSYKTADSNCRSSFYMSEKEIRKFLDMLKQINVSGAVILCTCNRTDIYFQSENTNTYDILNALFTFKKVGFNTEKANRFVHINNTLQSTAYVLQVSAGLDSMAKGDKQIFSQLRESYKKSLMLNMQGNILERLMQHVIRMHKKIINETDFLTSAESLAYLSLKEIKSVCRDMSEQHILILGSGTMAKEVISYLPKFSFKAISICSRTTANAKKLANRFRYSISEWKEKEKAVKTADIIISCVSCKEPVLKRSMGIHSKIMVDLGMPINIEAILSHTNVLIDIDYIKHLINKNLKNKNNALSAVENIVEDFLKEYTCWYQEYVNRKDRLDKAA